MVAAGLDEIPDQCRVPALIIDVARKVDIRPVSRLPGWGAGTVGAMGIEPGAPVLPELMIETTHAEPDAAETREALDRPQFVPDAFKGWFH